MLEIYSKNITVPSGGNIPLNNVALIKGNTVVNSGTSTISFNRCGIYEVIVSATVSSGSIVAATKGGATPKSEADIAIQLFKDDVAVPQAVTGTGETGFSGSLSFATLVQVDRDNCRCNCCESPTNITIKNLNEETTYETVDVVVTKLV